MRRRMIDPQFWQDDKLASMDMTTRFIFIATWSFADDEGYYEQNYIKMRAVMFPYDVKFNVEKYINNLILMGFIEVYEVQGKKYHKIVSFSKYQKPVHPTPSEISKILESSLALNNPLESSPQVKLSKVKLSKVKLSQYNVDIVGRFEEIWQKYPKRLGRRDAERHFNATVKTEEDYFKINSALKNYIDYINKNRVEEKFCKHGSTWFNNWQDWVPKNNIDKSNTGTKGLDDLLEGKNQ